MDVQFTNKKIATWLRLVDVHVNDESTLIYRAYVRSNKDRYNWKWRKVPDFTDERRGLGYLFNMIVVPKLWYCKMDMLEGLFFIWEVGVEGYRSTRGPSNENPALALVLALEKMIDSGRV